MNLAAIVTLAIGESRLADWNRYCAATWQAYANRHHLDLIVIDKPFEKSDRSPAWQKCLVLSQPFVARYQRILLLDSDIAINANSPNPIEQVPEHLVGGVMSGDHIHDDLKPLLLQRLTRTQLPYERGTEQWRRDQAACYESYGMPPPPVGGVIQTGVLVANPSRHAPIFRAIYEGEFRETRTYEQVPLSHALLQSDIFCPIDSRFNSILFETLLVHHHFLFTDAVGENVTRAIVRAEFANNFFLHFAYNQSLIRFLAD